MPLGLTSRHQTSKNIPLPPSLSRRDESCAGKSTINVRFEIGDVVPHGAYRAACYASTNISSILRQDASEGHSWNTPLHFLFHDRWKRVAGLEPVGTSHDSSWRAVCKVATLPSFLPVSSPYSGHERENCLMRFAFIGGSFGLRSQAAR